MLKTALATMATLGLLAPTAHAQARRGRRDAAPVVVVTTYPIATYYPYVLQPGLAYPGPFLYTLPSTYVVPTVRVLGPMPE